MDSINIRLSVNLTLNFLFGARLLKRFTIYTLNTEKEFQKLWNIYVHGMFFIILWRYMLYSVGSELPYTVWLGELWRCTVNNYEPCTLLKVLFF